MQWALDMMNKHSGGPRVFGPAPIGALDKETTENAPNRKFNSRKVLGI